MEATGVEPARSAYQGPLATVTAPEREWNQPWEDRERTEEPPKAGDFQGLTKGARLSSLIG